MPEEESPHPGEETACPLQHEEDIPDGAEKKRGDYQPHTPVPDIMFLEQDQDREGDKGHQEGFRDKSQGS